MRSTAKNALVLSAGLVAACGSDDGSSDTPSGTGGSAAIGDAGGGSSGAGVAECFGEPLPARAEASLTRPEAPAGLESYVPTSGWRTASPAEVGMSDSGVEAALAFDVQGAGTEGLLIVRHGYVVGERYFGSFGETSTHESFSMAKSFTSALIGIAIDAGLLSGTDERICGYYDEWDCSDASDLRSTITVDDAMNIRTGLQWQEDWRGLGAPNDAFSADILATALARPVVEEPGTHQRYSTGDPALLTQVIQGATGRTVFEYATEQIFAPLGIESVSWASDSRGWTTAYAGLALSVRDFAKFGLLYLQEGAWDGEQLVPSEWVHRTTQPVDYCAEQYRYLWHVNAPMRLGAPDPTCPEIIGCRPLDVAELPGDAYFAEGAFGQAIYVVPSADVVAVRVATDPLDSGLWDAVSRTFLGLVLDAVID
jgi:CubicO group peptidase (beta-lactamase class C family)